MALEDGYTQAKIAQFIGVSRSLVCKAVKGIKEE
ncbi:MAG: helix-turn-helix domain-containing protein [Sulfurimonas sp.]